VVLEAGAADDSTTWSKVQPKVARFTRVCSYDRSSRGKSEPGLDPNNSKNIVSELRVLLSAAKIDGPYVLTGYAAGGMHMQLYARLYPKEVAGLVLVDAAHEDAYLDEEHPGCPNRYCGGVDYVRSAKQVKAAPPMPNIPLLMHGKNQGYYRDYVEKAWPGWQRDLASRSPQGKLIIARDSSPVIPYDEPDLVASTIREVVKRTQ
jgi:pimeloyl-ACP methyl ester carboxylesterase